MLRILPVVVIVAMTIYCFVDCLQTPDEEVRNLPKMAWVVIILLFDVIGAVAWLAAGRPKQTDRAGAPWAAARLPGTPRPERPRRTLAPDDDPEFLRSMPTGNREHEDLLKQWEDDLRQREEKLRDDDEPPSDRPTS